MMLMRGGANGSRGSLLVEGDVEADRQASLWPGIVFAPSGIARAPANLSRKRGISFWVKGDGRTHRVAVISQSGRREFTFPAGPEWQRVRFDFPEAQDFDPAHFLYLIFAASAQPGHFAFQIDDVAFY